MTTHRTPRFAPGDRVQGPRGVTFRLIELTGRFTRQGVPTWRAWNERFERECASISEAQLKEVL